MTVSLEKDNLFVGPVVFEGCGHGRVRAHSRSRWGGNSLLPPVKLQMNTVGRESLQSCNTGN